MSSKFKSVRAAHRGVVTRLLNRVNGNPEELLREHNVNELSTIRDLIRNKEKTILELDATIVGEISEEEYEAEITDADRYTYDIQMTISKLSSIIDNANNNVSPIIYQADSIAHLKNISSTLEFNTHATEYVSDTQARPANHTSFPQTTMSNTGSVCTNASTYHKLPKLTLPSFGGNMLDWQPFWDSFSAAVHDNLLLNDVQKFNYLKSQLFGEASQCIAGLQITNTNYIQALQVLKRRFGQPHKIIDAYMQSLISLQSPTSDITEFKTFYDGMENYIRGLESMGQSHEFYGSLLVPIILNKIPEAIKENLVRDHGSDQWTLPQLRAAIEREITIKEASRSVNPYTSSTIQTAGFTPTSAFVASAKRNHVKTNITRKPCIFCNDVHAPITCTKVRSVEDRKRVVKEKNLCFNCLGNHKIAQCKSEKTCKHCPGKRHHTSICVKGETDNKTQERKQKSGTVDTTCTTAVANMHSSTSTEMRSNVLLKTAVTPVSSGGKQFESANILFDEGAQRSFITQEMASRLNLKPHQTESITISGFGESNKKVRYLEIATVYLKTENTELIPIDVLIVPQIAQPIQTYVKQSSNFQYLNGLKLAHPTEQDENFELSILVGADYFWDIVEDHIIRGPGPTAVKSKVGYLLSGPAHVNYPTNPNISSIMNILANHKEEECQIHKFWEIESAGIENDSDANSKLAQDEMNSYQNSSITFENNKYIARFPWKQDHPELPSNEFIAKRRTHNVITRLSKEPDMLEMYSNIIKDQEEKGFIEKIEDCNGNQDSSRIIHYIPHHPVKKDSTTTPIRIVYDCSCRANADSPSLNDCLSSTPPQLNRLTNILTRFRYGKYALTTDIEKAFLQVGLHEMDRDATRFFWMSNPNDPSSGLDTYRFKVVLFGATCSPFILSATLLKHLSMNPSTTSDVLKRDLYVDNVLTSFENEEMALNFYQKSRDILKQAGFNLRSWKSNSRKLMDIANQEHMVDVDMDTKILGMRWDANSDSLTFVKQDVQQTEVKSTKREILRKSASIFDPLGILGPVTVRAKILIQKLWKDRYEWDEILPDEISNTWKDIRNDIQEVTNNTKLTRHYFTEKDSNDTKATLHVFVDASQQAYGASAYISKGNSTALVIAKNRVAPVKRITLPKLELMAAVIGIRIATQMSQNLDVSRIVMWSDSQIVLHWIASKKPLCKFVQNRINEIRKLDCQWNYVPTDSNPADLQTRGITSVQFKESGLWTNGPVWITDEECWPKWTPTLKSDMSILTTTHDVQNTETPDNTSHTTGISRIIDITRFSSLKKLLHVTCYLIRFVKQCKRKVRRLRSNYKRENDSITQEEIRRALNFWIIDIQNNDFNEEKNELTSKLQSSRLPLIRQLRLFIDQEGIIRCAGRIQNSDLDYSTKYPILLPKKNVFTDLVVVDTHRRLLHAGTGQTITSIRQSYWIPSIRQCVNYLLRRCIQCRKVTGKPYAQPVSPPLPKDRVKDVKPFATTGVDFAGPLYIRDKGQTVKSYVCLFTCACIRAVHLELVADMTLDAFMLAFRRFVSRRGTPTTIYSDNAQTFISADREIPKSMNIHVNWKFIPKAAPWYGGWWERLVGLTKTSLKKVLGRSQVTFEVLRTVLTEIECLINDRPITYVSSDIRDLQPLTPSQLLHGRSIPSYDVSNSVEYSDDREILNCESANRILNRKRALIEHFGKRWRTEYLTALREFHLGQNKTTEQLVKNGAVVQIMNDSPRPMWKLGVIEEVINGNDGLIRAVKIRTTNGFVTTRPIAKLVPLEL